MEHKDVTSLDILHWMEDHKDCMCLMQDLLLSHTEITLTHISNLLELDGAECLLPLLLDSPEDIEVYALHQALFWKFYRDNLEHMGGEHMLRLVRSLLRKEG